MLYTLIQTPRQKEEVIFVDVANDKGYSFSGRIDTSSRENPLIEIDVIVYSNVKDAQEAYRCVLKQKPFPVNNNEVMKKEIQEFVETEMRSFTDDLSQEATQFAVTISEVIYRDILEYLRKCHN